MFYVMRRRTPSIMHICGVRSYSLCQQQHSPPSGTDERKHLYIFYAVVYDLQQILDGASSELVRLGGGGLGDVLATHLTQCPHFVSHRSRGLLVYDSQALLGAAHPAHELAVYFDAAATPNLSGQPDPVPLERRRLGLEGVVVPPVVVDEDPARVVKVIHGPHLRAGGHPVVECARAFHISPASAERQNASHGFTDGPSSRKGKQ